MLHAIALACISPDAPGEVTDDTSVAVDDTSGGQDTDTGPIETNGVAPDEPMPLIEFAATNRDGAARSETDLVGKPTALWFYPAANTPG